MTSKIRAIRLSHFWSVAFIVMIVNTGMNIFVLSNTYQSYNYPGLLIGMIFFGGLAALMATKLGLHPQLNSSIFTLALVPEFINIYVLSPESFSGLVFSSIVLVLSLDKRINKIVRSILMAIGVLNFDLTKLDELGTVYSEIVSEYIEIGSVVIISCYIVYRYFDDGGTQNAGPVKQKEDVLDQDEYQENMKFWLHPNFKYRIQSEQYDFLSKSLMEPLESSYPFLRNYAQAGGSNRYPLIRIYTVNGAPIMEATNVAFAEEANTTDLKSILRRHDYDIYFNSRVEDAFNIAPLSLSERFSEKEVARPISDIRPENNGVKKSGIFKRKNKDNFVVQADANGNDILIGAPYDENQAAPVAHNDMIIGGPVATEAVAEVRTSQESPITSAEPAVADQRKAALQEASNQIEELMQSRLKSSLTERYQANTAAAQEEPVQEPTPEKPKNKFVDPEYRDKRKFDPKAGRSLAKFRTIDEDGGSQDFQWNVPSK